MSVFFFVSNNLLLRKKTFQQSLLSSKLGLQNFLRLLVVIIVIWLVSIGWRRFICLCVFCLVWLKIEATGSFISEFVVKWSVFGGLVKNALSKIFFKIPRKSFTRTLHVNFSYSQKSWRFEHFKAASLIWENIF